MLARIRASITFVAISAVVILMLGLYVIALPVANLSRHRFAGLLD